MSEKAKSDPVNPSHYKNDSSGFECIELAEHFNSGLLQQAFQYVWRAGQKDDIGQEIEKALWFIGREHDYRAKHPSGRVPGGHSPEAEEIFVEWRSKVRSDLRAAALATLWRLDERPQGPPVDFYTVCEIVAALRGGVR